MAKSKSDLPLCACGCGRHVRQARFKFYSHECSVRASRKLPLATPVDALLTGTETPEERLLRENTQLRNELKKANASITQFQGLKTVEDRLAKDVLEFITKNPYRPTIIKPQRKAPTSGDHEMMLVLSDAHFPEVVDPDAAMGLSYGPDVCMKRLQYIADKTIRYKQLRQSAYPVRKLTVACVGDMLGGDIHEELEITNAMPLSQATVELGYALHDMGLSFASEFEQVEFIVIGGNHSRTTKKPRAKQKWNNWEYVLGHLVKALAGSSFDVVVPKSLVYRHRIFDKVIGLTHGDGVKSNSFAGIPFYGLRQRQEAMQSMLRQLGQDQLDHLVMGHWHTWVDMDGGSCQVFVNPSIKGGDEYSIGTLYKVSQPAQGLMTFHTKHGLTDISRITLSHVN